MRRLSLLIMAVVLLVQAGSGFAQESQSVRLPADPLELQVDGTYYDFSAEQTFDAGEMTLKWDGSEGDEYVRRTFHPQRFWYGVGGMVAANAVGMYLLAELWYSEYETQSWRWYNDNPNSTNHDGWLDDWHDWAQMDQLGHFLSGMHLARAAGAYGRWSGLSDGWAGVLGGAVSSAFLTQIEIFDGWSAHYGASRVDLLADYLGATVGGLQVAYPELEWFTLKYSYHPSPYYDDSIPFLGNVVGDYDGDSIWFTFRPSRILPGRAGEQWPRWLGLSLGIGGDGLAHSRSGMYDSVHRRQVFLSLDLDWVEVVDLPEPWNTVANIASIIRIPMPALEVAPDPTWHWIYY